MGGKKSVLQAIKSITCNKILISTLFLKILRNTYLQCHISTFYGYFNSSPGLFVALGVQEILIMLFKPIHLLFGSLKKQLYFHLNSYYVYIVIISYYFNYKNYPANINFRRPFWTYDIIFIRRYGYASSVHPSFVSWS